MYPCLLAQAFFSKRYLEPPSERLARGIAAMGWGGPERFEGEWHNGPHGRWRWIQQMYTGYGQHWGQTWTQWSYEWEDCRVPTTPPMTPKIPRTPGPHGDGSERAS